MAWVDTINEEKDVLEPVWIERAKEILGEDPATRDELMKELKNLVDEEEGLTVPNDDNFYLMFLRSGLMVPKDGFGVMKNYFLLKKNYPRYFEVLFGNNAI